MSNGDADTTEPFRASRIYIRSRRTKICDDVLRIPLDTEDMCALCLVGDTCI